MAIVFHSEKYHQIKLDSHMIIGITGYNYKSFLKSITGESVFYIGNSFINSKKNVSSFIDINNKISEYLKDLNLDKSFLDKRVNDLSHSEKRLLQYLKMLISDLDIIIVDEPFLDLDYDNKKRIINIFKKLAKKKTIIIGSCDMDIIYTQCKKVLLLGKKKYLYDDVIILANKQVLKQYNVIMPEILEFIKLAKDKKKKLPYSKDVRDLIKDVYRNVSK